MENAGFFSFFLSLILFFLLIVIDHGEQIIQSGKFISSCCPVGKPLAVHSWKLSVLMDVSLPESERLNKTSLCNFESYTAHRRIFLLDKSNRRNQPGSWHCLSDPHTAPHSLLTSHSISAAFRCEKCSSFELKTSFACIGVLATLSYGYQKPMHTLHEPRASVGTYRAALKEWAGLEKRHSLNLIAQLQIKQNLIPTLASDFLSNYCVLSLLLWSHKDEPCTNVLRLRPVGGFLTVLTQLLQTWDPLRASLN